MQVTINTHGWAMLSFVFVFIFSLFLSGASPSVWGNKSASGFLVCFCSIPGEDEGNRSADMLMLTIARRSGLLLVLLLLASSAGGGLGGGAFVGVNIGTAVSNMPSPAQVVALLKAQQITHVRLFDADRLMLTALANTGIEVMIGVPNNQLLGIGESSSTAANWINKNVAEYLPNTNITAIAVGSEVLTAVPNAAPVLVSAMRFLHSALVAADLDRQVKVSSPHAAGIILDSFPPSQAFFNASWNSVMEPMLEFLAETGSFLMLNVYPYYVYVEGNGVIALDYALFRPLPPSKEAVDSNTLLHYTNVFDAVVDAAYFAMAALNHTDIPVVVTETGWPSAGDVSEPDATVDNADAYNSNLVRHIQNDTGTPKRPGVPVSAYIYELFNEDLRPGAASERNWGLFNPDRTPVYVLHLSGVGLLLANDTTDQTFCVALPGADPRLLQAALDWACGLGQANCSAIQAGQPCYDPNTVQDHASYAFDSYYQMTGKAAGSCVFNGVGAVVTTDPSHDSCVYPGRLSSNGTSGIVNGTFPLNGQSNSSSNSSSAYHLQLQAQPLILPLIVLPFLLWSLPIL